MFRYEDMKEFLSLNFFLSVLHMPKDLWDKQELPALYEHALKTKHRNNPKFEVLFAELEIYEKEMWLHFFIK